MAVEKTLEQIYHGNKWGYVVVALLLIIFVGLLGLIFYLVGEDVKAMAQGLSGMSWLYYTGLMVAIIAIFLFIALLLAKFGLATIPFITAFVVALFAKFIAIFSVFWSLFSNIYILIITVILITSLGITALWFASQNASIGLNNPIVIGILVAVLILFIPIAIFLIDLYSLEEE